MDLSGFTAEQLDQLRAALMNTSNRSPMKPRQLHNLTLLPTKDDPRPTFFWSVESPRDDGGEARRTHPYPRLMWHQDGTEIRVENEAEHHTKKAQGYLEVAPGSVVLDQAEQIRQMLEQLSPSDRALVIDGQKKARMAAIQDEMAGLSPAELESVLASFDAKAKKSA